MYEHGHCSRCDGEDLLSHEFRHSKRQVLLVNNLSIVLVQGTTPRRVYPTLHESIVEKQRTFSPVSMLLPSATKT